MKTETDAWHFFFYSGNVLYFWKQLYLFVPDLSQLLYYQTWNWGYFFFFQVDELIKKYEKAEAEAEAAKKDKEKIK